LFLGFIKKKIDKFGFIERNKKNPDRLQKSVGANYLSAVEHFYP